MPEKKRVLFVCMGNICRSPAGEGVMKHQVRERGIEDEYEIDSAGTIGYHEGEHADPRMTQAAGNRGYQLTSKARRISARDFDRFDLIVAMDRENLRDILLLDKKREHRDKIKLFCHFIPGCETEDVPDPYFGGGQGFEMVLDMVEKGCENIIEYLENGKRP